MASKERKRAVKAKKVARYDKRSPAVKTMRGILRSIKKSTN
jgi:hypothetical protein